MKRSRSPLVALLAGIVGLVSGTVLAAARFAGPHHADTASLANATATTLDILALREHPENSPVDKRQIIEEYRRSFPGWSVLVKRVSWGSALSTPYGSELGQSQMNPNHASVYAVLVTGAIGSDHPGRRQFVVLRLADRQPIFEAGFDSAADPPWYRGLRDLH